MNIKLPGILALVLIIFSCNQYELRKLELDVKSQIIDDLRADNISNVQVQDVQLEFYEQDYYVGTVTTIEEGEYYYYNVEVEIEGDYFYYYINYDETYDDSEQDYYKNTVEEQSNYSESYKKKVTQKSFDLKSHLTNNTFSVNGNGSVYFTIPRASEPNKGTIRITGGRADLGGEFVINSNKSITITKLQATYGYFDASNNEGSSGSFYLNEDGSLHGSLYSGGESVKTKFIPR